MALLHSFHLDAAVSAFTGVAAADPGCGMARWGVAMAWLGNPPAGPPSARGLKEGSAAVEQAKAAGAGTDREREYIAAIETFYKDADRVDHRTRALAYERAMEQIAARYPADREAAVFYALALNITLATEKHPVTPGAIKPARELLGEMLVELGQPADALKEFEASHLVEPNRFQGLYGAARAAELAGDRAKARTYYGRLVALGQGADGDRPELKQAKIFIAGK